MTQSKNTLILEISESIIGGIILGSILIKFIMKFYRNWEYMNIIKLGEVKLENKNDTPYVY
jgi:hypothetical protein